MPGIGCIPIPGTYLTGISLTVQPSASLLDAPSFGFSEGLMFRFELSLPFFQLAPLLGLGLFPFALHALSLFRTLSVPLVASQLFLCNSSFGIHFYSKRSITC